MPIMQRIRTGVGNGTEGKGDGDRAGQSAAGAYR